MNYITATKTVATLPPIIFLLIVEPTVLQSWPRPFHRTSSQRPFKAGSTREKRGCRRHHSGSSADTSTNEVHLIFVHSKRFSQPNWSGCPCEQRKWNQKTMTHHEEVDMQQPGKEIKNIRPFDYICSRIHVVSRRVNDSPPAIPLLEC